MSKLEKSTIEMVAFRRWSIVVVIVVILMFVGLAALWNNQQVRQTLCTLRCQHIEDDAAWEVCIGECLVKTSEETQ